MHDAITHGAGLDLGTRRVGRRLPLVLGVPPIVVLLCPVLVDGARTHRLEGAFHADRADVGMADADRNEDQGGDAVCEIGELSL